MTTNEERRRRSNSFKCSPRVRLNGDIRSLFTRAMLEFAPVSLSSDVSMRLQLFNNDRRSVGYSSSDYSRPHSIA